MMTLMFFLGFIAAMGWGLCGVFAYGATLAHFQRRFRCVASENYDADRRFAACIALLGPIGLIVTMTASWKICGTPFYHGFQFGSGDDGTFKSCVVEFGLVTQVLLEDVSRYSEPVYPGGYHVVDWLKASNDQRVVGIQVWNKLSK